MRLIKLMLALLMLAGWSVTSARADVVIYRLKQTGKFIGASNEIVLRGGGFLLVDPDTKQGYTIQTASVLGTKFFTATTFTNTRIYNIIGAKGKTYTAFASSSFSADRDRSQFSRGQNALLAITPARTINFPRVITGMGSTVSFIDPQLGAFLVEGKATATFSLPDTRSANGSGETVDETYQRIRASLLAQGYAEFDL